MDLAIGVGVGHHSPRPTQESSLANLRSLLANANMAEDLFLPPQYAAKAHLDDLTSGIESRLAEETGDRIAIISRGSDAGSIRCVPVAGPDPVAFCLAVRDLDTTSRQTVAVGATLRGRPGVLDTHQELRTRPREGTIIQGKRPLDVV